MKFMFKKFALLGLFFALTFTVLACNEVTTVTEISDADKVQAVIDSFDLGDVSALTADLTLPTSNSYGATVTWSSANQDVISNDGVIQMPNFDEGDVEVVLTVTVTIGSASDTKDFTVTVSSEDANTFLTRAGNLLIIDGSDSIVSDFILPGAVLGATVTWVSSNTDMVSINPVADGDGNYKVTVTRPVAEDGGENTTVTLTATLTYGDNTLEVVKTVRIIAEPPAAVYTSFATLHSTASFGDYIDVTGVVYAKFAKGYFIKDSEGAFLGVYTNDVDKANEVTYGDEVHLKGIYKSYYTLFQINDLVLQEVISHGNDYSVTPIVLADANDLLSLDTSNKLINGQVYTVTVTPQLLGTYSNTYLFVGTDRVATVYYGSVGASIDALEAYAGKVVTINVVYYTYYTGSSLLESGVPEVYVIFDGLDDDIEAAALTGQDALNADQTALSILSNAVGGQSVSLPTEGGYGSAITWAITSGSEYATLDGSELTFSDVADVQSVVMTATLTLDDLTAVTKEFTIPLNPITTSTISDVQALNPDDGDVVQVQGIVYFFLNNGYYVFDSTGMIFVYSPAPDTMMLGDEVVIFGTFGSYNDEVQIKSAVVKSTVSTENDYTQTPIVYDPETTELVSGQTYTVTGTVAIEGTYNNVYLYDGDTQLFTIYYHSTINDSLNALKAQVGKEITFNAVFYGVSGGVINFVYQEGIDGLILPELTAQEKLDADVANLTLTDSVFSGDEVVLPTAGYESTIVWAVTTGTDTVSIVDGSLVFVEVSTPTDVIVQATVSRTGLVDQTKNFTITVNPIALSTISDVKAMDLDTTVKIQGYVYFMFQTGYYVYDSTGMILIYTYSTPTVTLGDEVVVQGTFASYKGEVQIKNPTVKSTESTGNDVTQTPIEFVTGTTELVSGQTYTITCTVAIEGSYNNVYLYDGTTLIGSLYYKSLSDSISALKAEVGKEIVANFVYYNNKDTEASFVYQEGVDGIALTSAQVAIDNADALNINMSVVSEEVVDLPTTSGTANVSWAITAGATYATLVGANITYAAVTSAQTVELTATLITPNGESDITSTKVFTVTISTYEQKLAEDVADLTIALTGIELDEVALPTEGLNGTAITWVLDSGTATLTDAYLVFDYVGAQYSIALTATLTLTEADSTIITDTKSFTVVVSPRAIVTDLSTLSAMTDGDWTIANGEKVLIQGVVTGFGYNVVYLQDENGNGFAMYKCDGYSNDGTISVGDQVLYYGKLDDYPGTRQFKYGADLISVIDTNVTIIENQMSLDDIIALTVQDGGKVITVTGLVISEFGSKLVLKANGSGDTSILLDMYYADATNWLSDIYAAGDVLGEVTFTFVKFSSGNIRIELLQVPMTDQQALDIDVLNAPDTVILSENSEIPIGDFGTTFAVTSITGDAAAFIDFTTTPGTLLVTQPTDADKTGVITVEATHSGVATTTFTINVTVKMYVEPTAITELFISEYVEGGGYNKAIEIYNGTGVDVDLSNYSVKLNTNANTTWGSELVLSGILADGGTYVIVLNNTNTDPALIALADIQDAVVNFNGDDAIGLFKNDTLIDLFGVFGEDPGSYWVVGTGTTADHTLVRKATVTGPVTTWNPDEWDVYAKDTFTNLGSHTVE